LTVVLHASADVNPDGSGSAAPVVVRVLRLRGDAAFLGGEYFALYDHEAMTLAADLAGRDEFQLAPGETRKFAFTPGPDVRFIGIVVGYGDYRHSQWRALKATPEPRVVGKQPIVPVEFQFLVGKAAVTAVVP